jgi:hypothetical protein
VQSCNFLRHPSKAIVTQRVGRPSRTFNSLEMLQRWVLQVQSVIAEWSGSTDHHGPRQSFDVEYTKYQTKLSDVELQISSTGCVLRY